MIVKLKLNTHNFLDLFERSGGLHSRQMVGKDKCYTSCVTQGNQFVHFFKGLAHGAENRGFCNGCGVNCRLR